MHIPSDTRQSLILRLRDANNEAAWEEFVSIYRPVIIRVAIVRGLQANDAEDVAQQVLVSVSKKIAAWESDPNRGRFRTWLNQVVRNAAVNALTRRTADRGIGGTDAMQRMHAQLAPTTDLEELDIHWRREIFRWAADQIRDEFQTATWEAFWLTAVESLDACEVAKRVGKSVGAVYVARSRVMQRLQEKVRQLRADDFEERRHDD